MSRMVIRARDLLGRPAQLAVDYVAALEARFAAEPVRRLLRTVSVMAHGCIRSRGEAVPGTADGRFDAVPGKRRHGA
jgi:hypothetical protein